MKNEQITELKNLILKRLTENCRPSAKNDIFAEKKYEENGMSDTDLYKELKFAINEGLVLDCRNHKLQKRVYELEEELEMLQEKLRRYEIED